MRGLRASGAQRLALTYQNQGRLKEATKLHMQVLKGREKVLGKEHPDTLASMGALVRKYQDQGRLDEIEALQVHSHLQLDTR
jgi:hypothetical protein